MRRLIAAATASLLLLIPSAVNAGVKTQYTRAYYTVAHSLGKDAPGRNIRKYGMRSGRRATRADLTRSLATLEAMLKPPPVATQPVVASHQTAQPNPPTATGGGGGSCPQVIPGYIIQRESGGDPNARNPSGAFGCYQLMPEHFAPGGECAGMGQDVSGQASCATKLWHSHGSSPWAQTR